MSANHNDSMCISARLAPSLLHFCCRSQPVNLNPRHCCFVVFHSRHSTAKTVLCSFFNLRPSLSDLD